MISSKIASLEARIARLESSLKNKTATGWSPQSGAPATVKDILSFMSKLHDQRSSFPENVKYISKQLAIGTFNVDFSGDWDYDVGLYPDPNNTLAINFKLEIEQMPPLVGQFGDYASDYPETANFFFSVNGKKAGEFQIILNDTKNIVKQLYNLDKELEKIYNKFGGFDF